MAETEKAAFKSKVKGYSCLGQKLGAERREEVRELIDAALAVANSGTASPAVRKEAGQAAKALEGKLATGREGCGADLTKIVRDTAASFPKEGGFAEYKCPKCGCPHTVRKGQPKLDFRDVAGKLED